MTVETNGTSLSKSSESMVRKKTVNERENLDEMTSRVFDKAWCNSAMVWMRKGV